MKSSTCGFRQSRVSGLLGLTAAMGAIAGMAVAEPMIKRPEITTKIGGTHMPFIANEGQLTNPQIRFYGKTWGGTVYVMVDNEIVYALPNLPKPAGKEQSAAGSSQPQGVMVVKERFSGATYTAAAGEQQVVTKVNYFVGSPSQWKSNIGTYEAVNLGEVYPGITARLIAHGNNVEKVFTVAPGGDPSEIELAMEGARSMRVEPTGELALETELGKVRFTKPAAYQEKAGKKESVDAAYWTAGARYGVEVGDYDPALPLIIDPLLASTYLGGTNHDYSQSIAVDHSGNVFIAGYTLSTNFPVTPGAYDVTPNKSGYYHKDVVVCKFDNQLTHLLASTYIGGTADDCAYAMALDPAGNVYITGYTESTNFPTTVGAYDTTPNQHQDVFVSKLSGDLSQLLASTYLGGDDHDRGYAIALDASGAVYVTGCSGSENFPVTAGAYDKTYNGGPYDVFVSKLDGNLSHLLASTLLGGIDEETGHGIAVEPSGAVFVTGNTQSTNFPTTPGAYDRTHKEPYYHCDIFVSKLNANLSQLLASTLLGGKDYDYAYALVLDPAGNVYITGYSRSTDYPTTPQAYATRLSGSDDVIVSKLDGTLSRLLASTFIGGDGDDYGYGLALDHAGNVVVAGWTESEESYPVTPNAYDTSPDGWWDVIVSKLDADLQRLLVSTMFGSLGIAPGYAICGNDECYALALDAEDNIYVTGLTWSGDFPTTINAYDRTCNGNYDIFVSKLDSALSGYNIVNDFDGDRKADPALAVYDGMNIYWYVRLSGNGYLSITPVTHLYKDREGGILLSGDFDGDRAIDFVIFDAGDWYFLISSQLYVGPIGPISFGAAGWTPLVGDMDGDGKADMAIFGAGTWYFKLSSLGYSTLGPMSFGTSDWIPLLCDFDGDHFADPAIYRNGVWYINLSSAGYATVGPIQTCSSGWMPMPGDYDGDCKGDLAVYASGLWYFWLSSIGYQRVGPVTL